MDKTNQKNLITIAEIHLPLFLFYDANCPGLRLAEKSKNALSQIRFAISRQKLCKGTIFSLKITVFIIIFYFGIFVFVFQKQCEGSVVNKKKYLLWLEILFCFVAVSRCLLEEGIIFCHIPLWRFGAAFFFVLRLIEMHNLRLFRNRSSVEKLPP